MHEVFTLFFKEKKKDSLSKTIRETKELRRMAFHDSEAYCCGSIYNKQNL